MTLKRPDNEYKRCGTANVFCAVEPKAGKHFTLATPNRSAPQLAQALETIIAGYPAADTIHMVMDNLNIHRPKTLTDYVGKDKGRQLWSRLTVHYTPKHGGRLNRAEIEISLFARQCLARRRIPTLAMLQQESVAWNSKVKQERIKINWQFTRKKARVELAANLGCQFPVAGQSNVSRRPSPTLSAQRPLRQAYGAIAATL